jgi:hypothetical protein
MAHTDSSHRKYPRIRWPRVRGLALAAACVAAIGVAGAPAANASGGLTGVYTGKAVHDPFSFAPDLPPYETTFVLRMIDGQLSGIYAEARLECPEVSITDLRVARLGMRRMPALSPTNGFTLRANGVIVRGHVGRNRAAGTIHASKGDCESPDITWTAARRR